VHPITQESYEPFQDTYTDGVPCRRSKFSWSSRK